MMDGEQIAIYAHIAFTQINYKSAVFISAEQMSFQLYKNVTWRHIYNVRESISSMINNGFINGKEVRRGLFSVEMADVEKYHFIFLDDIMKIIVARKIKLLPCYKMVVGTRNNNTKVSRTSIARISEEIHSSAPTTTSYIKELEDLKILFVHHNHLNNGQSNFMGRLCDKDSVIAEAKNKNSFSYRSDNSNWRRSVSARYNRFVANPSLYNAEEIATLREDVTAYNQTASSPKDLSVFSSGTCVN